MSRLVKDLIIKQLKSRYESRDSAVWVEMLGVDGLSTTEFRRSLHNKKMKLEIVKRSLFQKATTDKPLFKLAERLSGPAAIISGGESATDIAKLIEEWMPKIKQLKMRGALLDGEYMDETQVQSLSKMPTKRDLQCRVAGVIRSPGANLSAAILSGGGRIAGAIKSMIEKLEKGESIGASVAQSVATTPEPVSGE